MVDLFIIYSFWYFFPGINKYDFDKCTINLISYWFVEYNMPSIPCSFITKSAINSTKVSVPTLLMKNYTWLQFFFSRIKMKTKLVPCRYCTYTLILWSGISLRLWVSYLQENRIKGLCFPLVSNQLFLVVCSPRRSDQGASCALSLLTVLLEQSAPSISLFYLLREYTFSWIITAPYIDCHVLIHMYWQMIEFKSEEDMAELNWQKHIL